MLAPMTEKDLSRRGALQGHMRDVQENLAEFFLASSLERAGMAWEDVRIEAPEAAEPAPRPVLKRVA